MIHFCSCDVIKIYCQNAREFILTFLFYSYISVLSSEYTKMVEPLIEMWCRFCFLSNYCWQKTFLGIEQYINQSLYPIRQLYKLLYWTINPLCKIYFLTVMLIFVLNFLNDNLQNVNNVFINISILSSMRWRLKV